MKKKWSKCIIDHVKPSDSSPTGSHVVEIASWTRFERSHDLDFSGRTWVPGSHSCSHLYPQLTWQLKMMNSKRDFTFRTLSQHFTVLGTHCIAPSFAISLNLNCFSRSEALSKQPLQKRFALTSTCQLAIAWRFRVQGKASRSWCSYFDECKVFEAVGCESGNLLAWSCFPWWRCWRLWWPRWAFCHYFMY